MSNPRTYYDDNARNLSMNYRSPYLRLAVYHIDRHEMTDAVAILDTMEARVPVEVIPLD